MTGAHGSRTSDLVVSKKTFLSWLDFLRGGFSLIGPVKEDGQTEFREVGSSSELSHGVQPRCFRPGKVYLYKPREELFTFSFGEEHGGPGSRGRSAQRVIVGLHACDTNAVLYLDKTFLGAFRDPLYEARRNNTMIISLNCESVTGNCFCSSMGTGPFLRTGNGCDMLLTDLGEPYLVEIKTDRAKAVFTVDDIRQAGRTISGSRRKMKKQCSEIQEGIRLDGLERCCRSTARSSGLEKYRRGPLSVLYQLRHGLPHLLLLRRDRRDQHG